MSALQDLLVYSLKGLSLYANEGRKTGVMDQEVNVFTSKGALLHAHERGLRSPTVRFLITRSVELREKLSAKIKPAAGKTSFSHESANFKPETTLDGLTKQGEAVMEHLRAVCVDADIQSLQDILLYGLKGVAAYADHAHILGKSDDSVYAFMHEALAATTRTDLGLNDWVGLVLKCGEVNLKAMELLDAGNTGAYGHPVPTKVTLGAKKARPSSFRDMI